MATHETHIREVPGSNPGADQPGWGLFPWYSSFKANAGLDFRSFKVCSDAKERVECRKQREAANLFIPSKPTTSVPEFAVEDLPFGKNYSLGA